MGLDMNLVGRKYLMPNFRDPKKTRTEDGHRISAVELDLGYWRKHPDLHGYIVKTFDNKDECQRIDLDAKDLRTIISAVKNKVLPHTEGFFFGASYGDADEMFEDLKILNQALTWLEDVKYPKNPLEPVSGLVVGDMEFQVHEVNIDEEVQQMEFRSVYYQASW